MQQATAPKNTKYYSNELIIKAQNGDKSALDMLVKNNQPLVKSIVKRYYYLNESSEDIAQIANIGLINAIKRFDPKFNTQFSTYAVYLISGEIKKYYRDSGYVKAGRRLKEIYLKAKASKSLYLKEFGYEPGINEIAKNLNETVETISQAFHACEAPVYFEAPAFSAGDREITLKETICDDNNSIADGLELIDLKNALCELGKTERQLIVLRFFKNFSQSQTGELLGKSQVQISRMEKIILSQIKKSVSVYE